MENNPRLSFPFRPLCAAAAALAVQAPAAAQPTAVLPLQDASAFVESYLDHPAPGGDSRGIVVGATIVGVRLEGAEAPFDPANLRIRLGPPAEHAEGAERLCLKVITRDGRYFARGQYAFSESHPSAPGVEFKTAYRKVLAHYTNRDLATSAYKASNCSTQPHGEFVVSQLTPNVAADALIVQVRAGEARVRAQLTQDGEAVGPAVLCAPLTNGPTVGYTSECAIRLPPDIKSGRYRIMLGETSSSGDIKVKAFPLALWLDR